ncbi:hypothetical protein [Acidithiobacillus sp.]
MTELERQINHSLHALDRAHLLARITRLEYRERRRRLLTSLINDSHVVTARISINKSGAASVKTLQNRATHGTHSTEASKPKMFKRRLSFSPLYLAIGVISLGIILMIAYLGLRGESF